MAIRSERLTIQRLGPADLPRARQLFHTLSEIFETDRGPLGDEYLTRLLVRKDFWALVATIENELAGGLTAFTLPLTRLESSEIFLYDIAVKPEHQRQGIGRQLVEALRQQAHAEGIQVIWVPADNEDQHALDFYTALGGEAAPVTIFTLAADR